MNVSQCSLRRDDLMVKKKKKNEGWHLVLFNTVSGGLAYNKS